MSPVTLDSLTANESIPSRSRTFSPEVVARVYALLTGADGSEPAKNIGVGTFESEGQARSALVTLNRMLADSHGASKYAGTVREVGEGQYKAIIINRPAKAKKSDVPKGNGKAK